MAQYAWLLRDGGHLLVIYRIDPETRKVLSVMPLKRPKGMTEAEAEKYFNDNYPKSGSAVRAAADVLDTLRKSK
jgi:hypothetical protein